MYVAGTKSSGGAWDDLKLPLNLSNRAQRYKDAKPVSDNNKDIKNIVSHSLGGSVALELQKGFPDRELQTVTYGAPMASLTPSSDRFRNAKAVLSSLDRGAQTKHLNTLNTVTAHGYSKFDHTTGTNEYKMGDVNKSNYYAPFRKVQFKQENDNEGWIMSKATNNCSAPII